MFHNFLQLTVKSKGAGSIRVRKDMNKMPPKRLISQLDRAYEIQLILGWVNLSLP